MGIEPTWDFVEPHAGFEDQERHQAALHLHLPEPAFGIAHTGEFPPLPPSGLRPNGYSNGAIDCTHLWEIGPTNST